MYTRSLQIRHESVVGVCVSGTRLVTFQVEIQRTESPRDHELGSEATGDNPRGMFERRESPLELGRDNQSLRRYLRSRTPDRRRFVRQIYIYSSISCDKYVVKEKYEVSLNVKQIIKDVSSWLYIFLYNDRRYVRYLKKWTMLIQNERDIIKIVLHN